MTALRATRRTSRSLIGWTLAAALAAGAACAWAPAQATAASTKHEPPIISIGKFRPSFSPNGDGYHDRLRIPITLSEDAYVHARAVNVATGRTVVDRVLHDVGTQAGRHVITGTDLRYPSSPAWAPGRYRLTLVAHTYTGNVPTGRARTWFDYYPSGIVPAPGVAKANDGSGLAFSPNGDGVQDRARIGFALERRSRVTALLQPQDEPGPTRVVRLGVRRPGASRWVWDGRADRVRVADGNYQVTLRANPVSGKSRTTSEGRTLVTVDTTAPAPRVLMNRSTVYPQSTAFADSLRMGVALPPSFVTSAEVRSSGGKHVARLAPTDRACYFDDTDTTEYAGGCTLLTWYARQAGSTPMAAGAYELRVDLADPAGNTATVRKPVAVSSAQLVERTGSATWSASEAPVAWDDCSGNVCGEVAPCATYPSERFPGGTSFRSNAAECQTAFGSSYQQYGLTPDLPAGTTLHDRFRVTATGGPTSPGTPDAASVGIASSPTIGFGGNGPAVTMSGDTTATTEWAVTRPDAALFPAVDSTTGTSSTMRWYAGTVKPVRYDIASYTLDYTYWVPAT